MTGVQTCALPIYHSNDDVINPRLVSLNQRFQSVPASGLYLLYKLLIAGSDIFKKGVLLNHTSLDTPLR